MKRSPMSTLHADGIGPPTLTGGSVAASSTSEGVTLTVTITADDYAGLTPGVYHPTVAVDIGATDWLELDPGPATITIVADHHRT